MSECGCVYVDCDGYSETLRKDVVKARKEHKCGECGCVIQKGESYEAYAGKSNGDFFWSKTCEDCLSVRIEFFCEAWNFGEVWTRIVEHVWEMKGKISSDCLVRLTKPASDKVCDLIEEYWLNSDDD